MKHPYKKDLTDFGLRVWVLTNCFNRADICAEAMTQIYKTRWLGGAGWRHIWLNQHYPFDKKQNAKDMRDLCLSYGGQWMDAGRNLGLHEGMNYMLDQLGPQVKDEDFILMVDPDNFPHEQGWDDALTRVLYYDEKIGQSTLWQPAVKDFEHRKHPNKDPILHWSPEHMVDGIRVKPCRNAFVRTVTCWRAGDIRKVKGWNEPCAFWGHLESVMTDKFRKIGKGDVYLPDFFESSHPSGRINPEYQEWKVLHAHKHTVKVDLETWLRQTGRAHLIGPE